MAIEEDTKFVLWLLEYEGMPKMLTKNMANGTFVMIPFKHLINLSYDRNASTWQYSFVNKDIKMWKMLFSSLSELVETLLKTKEIILRIDEPISNPLYNKSMEELKIQYNLETC